MIYIKKIILTIIATIFTVILYSQEKNINIISSGDGITKDEATNAALRHCIEKTLGAFVSTNTTVINEKLITDEITTIASGNIINYEEISSVFNNSIYTVWVSAIISPENLILSFNKIGKSFFLKTNLYYQNILKEEFYKNQEILIIKDFIRKYQNYEVIDSFEIKIDDPFVNDSIEWYDLWDGEHRAHPFRNFEKIINKMYSNIGLGKLLDPQAWVLFSSNPNIYLFQNDKYYLNIKENEDKLTKYKNLSKESIQFILSQFRKQKIKEQSRSYINNNNYSIPIFYYPILNYEKYNNFIESLSSLLNNISIKNINDYASKYGYFKKIVLYYDNNKYRKTKKRSKDLSLNLYLRNEESYSILKIFCDNLFIRNNINSISINNIGFFPSSPSLVFSSPFNFNTVTTPKNTDLEYNKQASDLNFNLNNPVDYTAIKASGLPSYFYNGNNFQQKFLYTNLEPSLLILNLRKEELSKLSTLKFEFRK